jgi:hypothetical protein
MKLPWLIPLFATAALAQPHGGAQTNRSVPYLPTCVATSGSCPADGYICASGTTMYRCTIAGGWATIAGGTGASAFNQLTGTATDAQIPNDITITLAGTASALAANPVACSAGNYVTDIAADGTLTCATPAGSGDMLKATYDTNSNNVVDSATALAANGANCSGNNFALGVDASGAGECAQPAFSNLSGAATDAQVPNTVTIDLATLASTVTVVDAGGDTTTFPALFTAVSGSLAAWTDAALSYNATTDTLTTKIVVTTGSADNEMGLEMTDNSANCLDPASGNTAICTIAGKLYVKDTGATSFPVVVSKLSTTSGPSAWAANTVTCATACGNIGAGNCADSVPLDGTNTALGNCTGTTGNRVCLCY